MRLGSDGEESGGTARGNRDRLWHWGETPEKDYSPHGETLNNRRPQRWVQTDSPSALTPCLTQGASSQVNGRHTLE